MRNAALIFAPNVLIDADRVARVFRKGNSGEVMNENFSNELSETRKGAALHQGDVDANVRRDHRAPTSSSPAIAFGLFDDDDGPVKPRSPKRRIVLDDDEAAAGVLSQRQTIDPSQGLPDKLDLRCVRETNEGTASPRSRGLSLSGGLASPSVSLETEGLSAPRRMSLKLRKKDSPASPKTIPPITPSRPPLSAPGAPAAPAPPLNFTVAAASVHETPVASSMPALPQLRSPPTPPTCRALFAVPDTQASSEDDVPASAAVVQQATQINSTADALYSEPPATQSAFIYSETPATQSACTHFCFTNLPLTLL